MKSYEQMWKKLKSSIKDEATKQLISDLEKKHIVPRRKTVNKRIMKLKDQPWHDLYMRVIQLSSTKIKKGLITEQDYTNFRRQFQELLKSIKNGTKSDGDMVTFLQNIHAKYVSINKFKDYKPKRKSLLTTSGFERKSRYVLSFDERASIIIDELLDIYKPYIQDSELSDIDFKQYDEELKQELWCWCWEHRNSNPNLRALILDYNNLNKVSYIYFKRNILYTINSYATAYLLKLCFPYQALPKYIRNIKQTLCKYNENKEELIPIEDIEIIDDEFDIDASLTKSDNAYLVNSIFVKLDDADVKSLRRGKKILQMRYGFEPYDHCYTLQEIADEYGVSRERVRQMEALTLSFCRKELSRDKQMKGI